MKKEHFYYGLVKKIKGLYVNLILSIKSLFKKFFFSDQTANESTEEEQEIWFDALESQEEIKGKEEEVWFDALDNTESEGFECINAEECDDQIINTKEEETKYFSLQNERKKVDNQTLALSFQIEKDKSVINNVNLSSLKLENIYHVGNETHLKLIDENNNFCIVCAESLNVYSPEYFEKHSGKFYDEIFPKHENGISNHIVIMLQVPKEVDFLTERPSSFTGKCMKIVKSVAGNFTDMKIPKSQGVSLSYLDEMVNFSFSSEESNSIVLKIEEQLYNRDKIINNLVPGKTFWPVKNILVEEIIFNKKVATLCHITAIENQIETNKSIMVY